MDVVAMLPRWAGVALALASFLFLHGLAAPPSATGVQASQMATFASRAAIAGFASIGQLVVPLLFLFAALNSFLKRKKREGLVNQVT